LGFIVGFTFVLGALFFLIVNVWEPDEVLSYVGLMFFLVGVIIILYCRYKINLLRGLIERGKSLEGIVDEIYFERTSYMVKYHYELHGITYKKKEATNQPDLYQEGKSTLVIYDPNQPKKSILAEKAES